MTENTAAPTVDANAINQAKIASSIIARMTDKQTEIEKAFESLDIAETDGAWPATLKVASTFGLTPEEVTAWRPGARSEVSTDPVENAVRTAHNVFKPDSSPATRSEFKRILRLACHAAGEQVVADARGNEPGQYRQKNLPVVTDSSRKDPKFPECATRESALAALKAEVAKIRSSNSSAITFRVDPIAAINDAEMLAALNKQLATMTVQGGLFQSSLLAHLIEGAFVAECGARGVKPAKVWRDAVNKAKAALVDCKVDATTKQVIDAMNDAARVAVAQTAENAVTVKAVTVIPVLEQIVTARKAIYLNLRKLLSLKDINQAQYDDCYAVLTTQGIKDAVEVERLAAEEAERVRLENAARKKEEDAKRAQELKDASAAGKAKGAPVQASEAGEAEAAPTPKKSRAKFQPAPVAPVAPSEADAADDERNEALEALDNA